MYKKGKLPQNNTQKPDLAKRASKDENQSQAKRWCVKVRRRRKKKEKGGANSEDSEVKFRNIRRFQESRVKIM